MYIISLNRGEDSPGCDVYEHFAISLIMEPNAGTLNNY
jgi:hypothetical protein